MRFDKEIARLLKQIPKGSVSTYGEIAKAMGDVVASKTIYNILSTRMDGLAPVHRVVTAKGEVTDARDLHKLRKEGIPIKDDRVVNLSEHLFKDFKSSRILQKLRKEQEELASKIVLEDAFQEVETVGGIDVAYDGDKAYAACVIINSEGTELIEKRRISGSVSFPYVSTYLSYRELPIIKKIYSRLKRKPDVLMIDGNGILHPRRMGIASHAGLELDIPTIGVAKKLLLGTIAKTPKKIGEFGCVLYKGSAIGMGLKTSKSDNLVYISPGHKISMKTALELSRRLCFHRVPEPIRRAHRMATELRRARTS